MNPLFKTALEIQQFLEDRDWAFCFFGGLAVARWGQPRTTQDVDLTLLTGFGREKTYIDEMLAHFDGRLPDAGPFALDSRVLLLKASNGVPVDISLGGIAFERGAVARASRFSFLPGVDLLSCSAEDLVVFKAFAARATDWADVEGILVRQRGKLDWAYIQEQLAPLCELKEAPDILDRLGQLRAETDA